MTITIPAWLAWAVFWPIVICLGVLAMWLLCVLVRAALLKILDCFRDYGCFLGWWIAFADWRAYKITAATEGRDGDCRYLRQDLDRKTMQKWLNDHEHHHEVWASAIPDPSAWRWWMRFFGETKPEAREEGK